MTDKQNEKTPTPGQSWYRNVYLKSAHWRSLRASVLEAQDHHCLGCNATTNLDVHHIIYSKLYAEKVGEMMVLCRECHIRAHELWDKPPKKYMCEQVKAALRHYLCYNSPAQNQDSKMVKQRKRHNYNRLPVGLRKLITARNKALQAAVRDRMAVHEKEQPKRQPAQQGGSGLSLVDKYGEAGAFLIERIRQEEQHGDRGKVARGYRWFHIPPQEWMEKTDSLKTGKFHAAIRDLTRRGILVFCPTDGGKEKIRHYRLTI